MKKLLLLILLLSPTLSWAENLSRHGYDVY